MDDARCPLCNGLLTSDDNPLGVHVGCLRSAPADAVAGVLLQFFEEAGPALASDADAYRASVKRLAAVAERLGGSYETTEIAVRVMQLALKNFDGVLAGEDVKTVAPVIRLLEEKAGADTHISLLPATGMERFSWRKSAKQQLRRVLSRR